MFENANYFFLLIVWRYEQERREEKLDERELSLIAKEEEVVRLRKALYAQADEITALFVPSPFAISIPSSFLL